MAWSYVAVHGPMLRFARAATVVGLTASVVGLAVLVAQAASEVAADPTLSLEDGYWIGRLPWSAAGVGAVVLGATLAVVFGTLSAWLGGGMLRRLASSPAFTVAAFWWLYAMLPSPGGAPCGSCVPPGPEPLTFAYSLPGAALLLLLVPAALAGLLGLTTSYRERIANVTASPSGTPSAAGR